MAKWWDFLIYKKIKLETQNVNTHSSKLIKYVKHMKIEITKITVSIILFVKNNCNNNLFLNYSWKYIVQKDKHYQNNEVCK